MKNTNSKNIIYRHFFLDFSLNAWNESGRNKVHITVHFRLSNLIQLNYITFLYLSNTMHSSYFGFLFLDIDSGDGLVP